MDIGFVLAVAHYNAKTISHGHDPKPQTLDPKLPMAMNDMGSIMTIVRCIGFWPKRVPKARRECKGLGVKTLA